MIFEDGDGKKKELVAIVDSGLVLSILSVMVVFAFEKKKDGVIGQMKKFIDDFNKSLSKTESEEYEERVRRVTEQKMMEFRESLKDEFSMEEITEIESAIKGSSIFGRK